MSAVVQQQTAAPSPALPLLAGEQRRLVRARTFGTLTVCLRLPQADCVELNATAAELLLRHGRGNEAPPEVEALRRELGVHLDWVVEALAQSESAMPHPSPSWQPPLDFPPRRWATLPDRENWLLIVAATARAPRATEARREWRALRTEASQVLARRLRPIIAANLQAQGEPAAALGVPASSDAWVRNVTAFNRMAPVLRRLADAGIRVSLLKGAAAILTDYRDLARRPMNDVDLLVPLADRRRAIAVLESSGFRAHEPGDERLAHRCHGWAYVAPDHLNLDLHWHALWMNCWPGADDGFWAAARPMEIDGVPVFVPAPELRLLTTCVHGFRHQKMPAHYWIADVAALLTVHGRELDWDRLLAEADARRVTRTMREACRYLVEACGAPIPAEVQRRLDRARTAWGEDLIFESFQLPFPEGGAVRASAVSWLNQYRRAARGFGPAEAIDFLRSLSVERGCASVPQLLSRVALSAWRKAGRRREASLSSP